MTTRIYRLAAVCLMTAVLSMSGMSGAIAAANSDSDSKSGSAEHTSPPGEGETTSTADTKPTSTVSAQTYTSEHSTAVTTSATGETKAETTSATEGTETSTGTDHNVTVTTVSGTGPDKPSSTVSAQTNTSGTAADTTETPSTFSSTSTQASTETASVTETPVEQPTTTGVQLPDLQLPNIQLSIPEDAIPPASASNGSAATDETSGSDNAETAQALAATSSTTSSTTASTTASATSSVEETPTTATATTGTAAATGTVAETAPATPTFREAVVYFLRVLATATNFVDAIMQLPAEVRAALGIPWIKPDADGNYDSLLSTPNVALLNLMASSLPQAGSAGPGGARTAAHRGIEMDGGITLLTAQRPQLTPEAPAVLAAPTPPGRSLPKVVKDTVTAIVVSVSVWSLLYAALPGLGGLISFGAVGVRIGYRQANAGIALQTPELARFIRPGPIGVVRTGSLISVHSRTKAADPAPRTRHLESVA